MVVCCFRYQQQIEDRPNRVPSIRLRNQAVAPIYSKPQRIAILTKQPITPKRKAEPWRSELDVEAANRARLTASLREQRLKRDAEILAAGIPVTAPKRGARQKARPA